MALCVLAEVADQHIILHRISRAVGNEFHHLRAEDEKLVDGGQLYRVEVCVGSLPAVVSARRVVGKRIRGFPEAA